MVFVTKSRKGGIMRAILVPFTLLLLVLSADAQLTPYWIPDLGCVLTRGYPTVPYTVEAQEPLKLYFDFGDAWERHTCVRDDENDLCWNRVDFNDSGEEYWSSFTPPFKILDYPLTTGKTWQATYEWRNSSDSLVRMCYFTGTVIGPRTVETGVGPLEVIEVLHEVFWNSGQASTRYYLHEELGDVRDLLALDGCDVVATETTTWSTVKALHR